MNYEKIIINHDRNVTLDAWIQAVGSEFVPIKKRPAILILPGGGYNICSDREADPVAGAYLKAGYHVFILRYSVGPHKTWPNPLDDYEQVMDMIRNDTAWCVDANRVAVIGFSAGGHLAACAATIAKNRPNAAILGYAALKKEVCDMCQMGMPYPVEHVDADTPACFLFAARDDMVVDISNTLEFEMALYKQGISFESHIYSYGNHGYSTAEKWLNPGMVSDGALAWVSDSIRWLSELWGKFEHQGFSKPAFERMVNADRAEMLSAGCTIRHLKEQCPEVQELCLDAFQLIDQFIAMRFGNAKGAIETIYAYKLSEALLTLQVTVDEVLNLDEQLRKYPNRV